MRRNGVLGILVVLASVIALGAASANFTLEPMALDQGGGYASSSSYQLQGSIGGPAIGLATSASYKFSGGFVPGGGSTNWLQITQLPAPDTIGPGITSEFKWMSTYDGTYYIEVGGTGAIGSGTQIGTGSCTAGSEETVTVNDSQLADDASNTIFVIVNSAGHGVLAKQVAITDDETSPVITPTQVTISGTVDDATVTEVLVNGSSVTVTAGAYTAVVTTSMDTITIVATNADTKSVTKTVKVQ